MEEIKVGDYVRDKDGCIIKVDEIQYYESEQDIWYKAENTIGGTWKSMVTKHSPDIIDLIEEGDYVNGEKVLKINCNLEYVDDDSETGVNEIDNGIELQTGWIYFENEIENIVTHEMFESMKYEV